MPSKRKQDYETLGRGLESDPDLVESILYRLVDRSVAGSEEPGGDDLPIFRLFELVRLFALERLEREESPKVIERFRHLLVTNALDELGSANAPLNPLLRLDPTPVTAARAAAEREEWFGLAADLTDGLRTLHEADANHEAVRQDRRRAAELRERDGDTEKAVREYLDLARSLDGTEAENTFSTAEGIANGANLFRLAGEAALGLSAYYHAIGKT